MTRYAVDLDGVLADTVGATLEEFNQVYGTHYTKEDMTSWDFWNIFPELHDLRESKRKDIILRMMDKVWIEGKIKPEPGAAEFMNEQMTREPQTDILTGRGKKTPDAAIVSWLSQHDIPYRRIVRSRGSGDKVFFGYDVYIDDNPHLVMDIKDRWTQKRAFLVDQPWNHGFVLKSPRVKRVRDLREALPSGRQERLFRRRRPGGVHVRSYRRR